MSALDLARLRSLAAACIQGERYVRSCGTMGHGEIHHPQQGGPTQLLITIRRRDYYGGGSPPEASLIGALHPEAVTALVDRVELAEAEIAARDKADAFYKAITQQIDAIKGKEDR